MAEIRDATLDDLEALFGDIRPIDQAECEALFGDQWQHGVRMGAIGSMRLWAAEKGGRLLAVGGLAPISMVDGRGSPWLLGTRAMTRRDFVRISRASIANALAICPRLENWVWAGAATSVRWLRQVGFHVEQPRPYGPRGALFHRFTMEV